jgi:drug/metabolite transporter (DMT)-like permease
MHLLANWPNLLQSGEFYSFLCALVWAVAVIMFKLSGELVRPLSLNLFKNCVGVMLFALTLPFLGVSFFPDISPSDLLRLILSGLIGISLADTLFFSSLNRIGASLNSIVDCLYSPLVILLSILFLGDKITVPFLIGTGLILSGIVISSIKNAKIDIPAKILLEGIIFGVLSMLFMAISLVIMKPVLSKYSIAWLSMVRLFCGNLGLVAFWLFQPDRRELIACFRPSKTWKVIMPPAIIGSYVSYILWMLGLKLTYTSTAAVLNQMSAFFVIILAAIFLKERLSYDKVAAITLAMSGAILVSLG